jgi:hypothetical protein
VWDVPQFSSPVPKFASFEKYFLLKDPSYKMVELTHQKYFSTSITVFPVSLLGGN